MNLIIDANILFSALIKDGLTAELLTGENIYLFAPEFILEEFKKYSDLILTKTGRSEEEFEDILHAFLSLISIIPSSQFSMYLEKAREISPDINDVHYFALAMLLKCPIWSNDKALKSQNEVEIHSTADLLKLFKPSDLK